LNVIGHELATCRISITSPFFEPQIAQSNELIFDFCISQSLGPMNTDLVVVESFDVFQRAHLFQFPTETAAALATRKVISRDRTRKRATVSSCFRVRWWRD
jgi:hypothetical protein